MSFYASQWARVTAPVADIYERVILLNMAVVADLDGDGVFLSIPTLAESCLCDSETVRRRLQAMEKRGLIALGDQKRAEHIEKRYRPKVYNIQIPFRWFSEDQLAEINKHRAEHRRPPLTVTDRPPIAPAPPRKVRADKGKPNPKRRPKDQGAEDQGSLVEGSAEPVDNSPKKASRGLSQRGLQRGADPSVKGIEGSLQETQSKSFNRSATEGTTSVRTQQQTGRGTSTDGRTDDFSSAAPPSDLPVPDPEPRGSTLVAAAALQADLARIDAKPSQRRRLAKAVDAALLRFPEAQVARYLAMKAREAQKAMWLITAFEEFADTIKLVGNRYDRDAAGLDSALMDDIVAEVRAVLAKTDDATPAVDQDSDQEISPATTTAAPPARPAFVAPAPAKPAPQAPPLELFTAPGITYVPSRMRDQLKTPPDSPSEPSGVQASVAG